MSQNYSIVANIIAKTDQYTSAMNDAVKKADNMATNFATKTKAIGDGFTKVGKNLSLKVTAPIVGLAGAALKVGMDFESAMSNVAAISGATGDDFDKLSAKAREMGSKTSKSATESAEALSFMALAGWDVNQQLEGLEPILRLSEAGALDLGRASDLVTDSMSAMSIEVKDLPKYLDMVAKTAASSNTNIDALMEAYVVAGGSFARFGIEVDESAAMLGLLANRGFKASEAGTAMNAIMSNLTSGLGASGKAMAELGISAFDADGNFRGLETVLFDIKNKLAGMTEEQQANALAMIAGKEHGKTFQALLNGLGEEYGSLRKGIQESNGALDNMAKTMQDNAKGKLTELKSALEEIGIMFAQYLIPWVTKATVKITEAVAWFGNLSEGTQKTILTIGLLAAAIPPVIWFVGSLFTGISSIITVFGAMSGAIAGAGGALAILTGPIGLAVAGIAALTAGTIALVNYFNKDAIPEVDRFGDEVSDATKQALEGFFELSDGASTALADMKIRGLKVTDEMASEMIDKFDNMNQQILDGLNEKHDERIESMENFFLNSSVLTDSEEEKILLQQENSHTLQVLSLESKNERVKEILNTAAEENREITQAEADEINRINESMNENAVVALSASEIEQKIILERMKESAGDLSARQAAEVVKNSAEQRDGVITAAEEQYDNVVAEIIRMRDETGVITEEQATQLIAEAKRSRDESVKHAEDMHLEVVNEAKEMATGVTSEISWMTGEVRTNFESMSVDAAKWMVRFYSDTKSKFIEMATIANASSSNIEKSVNSSFETAKNKAIEKTATMATSLRLRFSNIATSASDKFEDVKEKIITPIEKARDIVKLAVDAIKGFFDNMTLSIPEVKLPSLPSPKISGGFSLNPPSAPKISWNAAGGIFNKPTIFNTANAGLQGVGEAGAEAILPLNSRTYAGMAKGFASEMLSILSNETKATDGNMRGNFVVNFNIDKMTGSQKDVDNFATKFMDKLKTERGIRK